MSPLPEPYWCSARNDSMRRWNWLPMHPVTACLLLVAVAALYWLDHWHVHEETQIEYFPNARYSGISVRELRDGWPHGVSRYEERELDKWTNKVKVWRWYCPPWDQRAGKANDTRNGVFAVFLLLLIWFVCERVFFRRKASGRIQFHLSTAVVVMFVCGLLMFANLGNAGASIDWEQAGWPFQFWDHYSLFADACIGFNIVVGTAWLCELILARMSRK